MSALLLTSGLASGLAWAYPARLPPPPQAEIVWSEGRQADVLVVKLVEGMRVEGGTVVEGPGDLVTLNGLLDGARPRFSQDPERLRGMRKNVDPGGVLADMTLYLEIRGPGAAARGSGLLADPRVETAFLALAPQPPPTDLPPETPNLESEQGYRGDAPAALGWAEAAAWPGGRGENVTVADLEYGWNPDHEDLADAVPVRTAWGWESGYYPCHGTMVLGVLAAQDNGYGVTGLVPDADLVMVSPYELSQDYNVGSAVLGAIDLLEPGDVLLIEQQAYSMGGYAPVEVAPDVWDAIAIAVASGIVVVEPAANGGADLDAPAWEGWFDRELRDSGAIMVGGGTWPDSGYSPGQWYPYGSSYGSRIDMHGWYGGIATTSHDPAIDSYCSSPDLFFEGAEQAYTSSFGGTSGASPMVTSVAAVAQSVGWVVRGAPWDPMDLRQAIAETGSPSTGDEWIGPMPDLGAFLRTWGWR